MTRRVRTAFKLFLLIAVITLYFVAYDNTFLVPARLENGRLTRENGVWVLCVKGSPYEMGYAQGKLLKAWIRQGSLGYIEGLKRIAYLDYDQMVEHARSVESHIPAELLDEIRGISDGSGVDFDRLLVLHTFLEYSQLQACSSYAVFGHAALNGRVIHGYNLEFNGFAIAHKFVVLIYRRPDSGNASVSVTWPGFAGTLAAMNDMGISASLLNVCAWKEQTTRDGLPYAFLVRELVEKCSSLEEARDYLRGAERTMGNNILICQADPPMAAVAEFTAKEIVFREAENCALAATNHYRKLSFLNSGESSWRCSRYDRIMELIDRNYGRIDDTMNFLKDKRVYQSFAIFSVLFYPDRNELSLAAGAYPAPEGTYRRFRIESDSITALP